MRELYLDYIQERDVIILQHFTKYYILRYYNINFEAQFYTTVTHTTRCSDPIRAGRSGLGTPGEARNFLFRNQQNALFTYNLFQ